MLKNLEVCVIFCNFAAEFKKILLMDREKIQKKAFSAIIESLRGEDLPAADAMGVITSAAVQAIILISEVTGRNTIRDLYLLRRNITVVINDYKELKL